MSAVDWAWVYATIATIYVLCVIGTRSLGGAEALFVFLAWPLDLLRVIARGAREWWQS